MAKIELDRVSLTFRVRKQQARMTLKEYLVRGLFLRPAVAIMEVRALQDLSLKIKAGEKGYTLVPLSLYFKKGIAKVELCIAKGRKTFDKREAVKTRDAKRDIDRAMRRG